MAIKNALQKTLLSIFIISSLSACEEILSDNIEEETPLETNTVSVTGKTADGYLVNAKVCGDLNNNLICDPDEPTSTSTEGGSYELTDIPETVDLSTLRIVVEVIANITTDEDKPDQPITKPYTLTAPPGQPAFISPITTIVDAVLKNNDALSLEDAEKKVKQDLGLNDTDVSLFDDYVEASNNTESASSAQYAQLHVVAQVVTGIISNSLSEINNSDESLTDGEAFAGALNAVVSNVEKNLDQITDIIEEIIENAEENADITALLEESEQLIDASEAAQLDAEKVEQEIIEIEEERQALSTNVEQLLTNQEGFFFLDSRNEKYWDGQQCVSEFEFNYEQFKIVDNIGVMSAWQYNFELQLFETEDENINDDNDFNFYQLGTDNWELTEEDVPQVISFSDDGQSLTVSFPGQGSRTIIAKEVDLFDKPLSDISRVDQGWGEYMMTGAKFPSGSVLFSLTMEQLEDSYIVPYFQCNFGDEQSDHNDQSTVENCNSIWVVETGELMPTNEEINPDENISDDGTQTTEFVDNRAISLDSLINTDWNNEVASLIKFHAPFGQDMLMSLVEENTGSETKRYSLFFKINYECHEGATDASGQLIDCERYTNIKESSWKIDQVNGQSLLSLDLGNDFDMKEEFNGVFLTEIDGLVRMGMYISAGFIWNDEYTINETALNSVVSGFTASDDHLTSDTMDCGYYDDGMDGDDGMGDDHGDGNNQEHEEQGPAPVLTSDPTNTALLVKTIYVMHSDTPEDGSDTLLLQFFEDSEIKIIGQEKSINEHDGSDYKEEFMYQGTWVVDSDGQVLISFTETEIQPDGTTNTYDNWKLFKIDGEIGTKLTLVENTPDEDELETLNLTKLQSYSSTDNVALEQAREGKVCNISLTFETTSTNNTGVVDSSKCADMEANDSGTIDFTWQIGDLGQLVIMPKLENGKESIEWFQDNDGLIYLVITGEKNEQDDQGNEITHHHSSVDVWHTVE